jgi:DNA-binding response OmpR family regulator
MNTKRSGSGFTPHLEFYEASSSCRTCHSQADIEISKDLEVLIVAEDFEFSQAIGAILQEQGYQIYLAPDVKTAVEELDNYNFDLLVIQLSRDSLEGLKAVCKAKQAGNLAKVMVISGPKDKVFPVEAFQMEVEDYLIFPFSKAELGRKVAALLGPGLLGHSEFQAKSAAEKINAQVLESLRLLMGEIRSSLVKATASLKNTRECGHISKEGVEKIDEVVRQISQVIGLANDFHHKTSQISQFNGW